MKKSLLFWYKIPNVYHLIRFFPGLRIVLSVNVRQNIDGHFYPSCCRDKTPQNAVAARSLIEVVTAVVVANSYIPVVLHEAIWSTLSHVLIVVSGFLGGPYFLLCLHCNGRFPLFFFLLVSLFPLFSSGRCILKLLLFVPSTWTCSLRSLNKKQ